MLFERNQNNDMTAVNYFSHTSPLNKNIFNQFGFAVGGPVWIPKIVQWQEQAVLLRGLPGHAPQSVCGRHQPDAAHGGDAHGRLQRHRRVPSTIPLTGNADGTGRTPFAGNIIPSNRIDPAVGDTDRVCCRR